MRQTSLPPDVLTRWKATARQLHADDLRRLVWVPVPAAPPAAEGGGS